MRRVDDVEDTDDLSRLKLKKAPGGGGTSFVPVFDAVKEMGLKPDALIYLTDGDGTFPGDCARLPSALGHHQEEHLPVRRGHRSADTSAGAGRITQCATTNMIMVVGGASDVTSPPPRTPQEKCPNCQEATNDHCRTRPARIDAGAGGHLPALKRPRRSVAGRERPCDYLALRAHIIEIDHTPS